METVRAAGVVVIRPDGAVLLVKRGNEPERGRWSVPGGRTEPGETLAQTAAREALEETGLHVEIGEELWSLNRPLDDGRQFEIHDFRGSCPGGDPVAGDDADDARWVAPEDLADLPLTQGLLGYLERAGVVGTREPE